LAARPSKLQLAPGENDLFAGIGPLLVFAAASWTHRRIA
jgi:hypothetical protein